MYPALLNTSIRRAQFMYKVQNKFTSIARAHECIFLARSRLRNVCFFPPAILVIFTSKIPYICPIRESRGWVHDPLKRLEGLRHPSDPTRGSRLTLRTPRGAQNPHPLGRSSSPPGNTAPFRHPHRREAHTSNCTVYSFLSIRS